MSVVTEADKHKAIEKLLVEMRPKLHRYCARMTGSVIDGEDVLQEVLVRALEILPNDETIENPEGWLIRVAHNAAMDFLRARARHTARHKEEDMDMVGDSVDPIRDQQVAAASLRTFMDLPVVQRGTVILVDVLEYSLQETANILDSSLPAVKSALHRGRGRLRELSRLPEERVVTALSDADRSRLSTYIEYFNTRNFDAVRELLANEVKLDLVSRVRMNGKQEVSNYVSNYSSRFDWHLRIGLVEGRPAVIATDPDGSPDKPLYFILLEWTGDQVLKIRDFRYARYVMDGADVRTALSA
jgi:RNA polymerase sigma-70 factor (ECF subfamily)